MTAPEFLTVLMLCALVLPAIPIVARNAYRCGRMLTGLGTAWFESWLAVCRTMILFGSLALGLVGVVALTSGAGGEIGPSLFAMILLLPCLACVAYVPLAGMVTFVAYNFGAQRRARDNAFRE